MKLKIAVRILGHKPPDFDSDVILKWRSSLWEIYEDKIDTLSLNEDCDLPNWGYSDGILSQRALPVRGADVSLFILNVPLDGNYYARRVVFNVGCISFYEVAEILRLHNIPIENFILRMLYSCYMIHAMRGSLPPLGASASIAHHETRGCIFDMTGIKTDIAFSCHRPILCGSCIEAARNEQVSNETILTFSKEIRKIRKKLFYRVTDWIKRFPILTLVISSFFALFVGIVGSLTASYLYQYLSTSISAH